MSKGAQVTLTAIAYEGRDRVLQIECESLPTELYWAGEGDESPFVAYCEAVSREAAPSGTLLEDPCVGT